MPQDRDEVLLTGEKDPFGHVRLGGVGEWLGREIEARTGKEARTTVLGHVQRGGTPTARDRWLATRFCLHAIDAVAAGQWGQMTALRGTDIITVPLHEATHSSSSSIRPCTQRPRSSSAEASWNPTRAVSRTGCRLRPRHTAATPPRQDDEPP
jgi:6-phosphofructokinase